MMKRPSFLPIFLLSLLSCSPLSQQETGTQAETQPRTLLLQNELPVDYPGGHIQGIQGYQQDGKDYFFFMGSSAQQSYYAVADIQQQKILSLTPLLDDPFRHAGGFQIFEDLLAVGIEDNYKRDQSRVMLYQILDPVGPQLQLLRTVERSGEYQRYTAGCVALTEHQDTLLLVVGNWDAKQLDCYTLARNQLKDPLAQFQHIATLDSETFSRESWTEPSWNSYQNINLLHDATGQLLLAGMALDEKRNREIVDLFALKVSRGETTLRKVAQQTFPRLATTTFKWGGGIWIDAQGRRQILSCGEQIGVTFPVNIFDWQIKRK